MVVVGIVGLLAGVGIPRFRSYQARSKTTEAKLLLAGHYTAQKTFHTDWETYASCVSEMRSPGQTDYWADSEYYFVSFSQDYAAACGLAQTNGHARCVANCAQYVYSLPTRSVNGKRASFQSSGTEVAVNGAATDAAAAAVIAADGNSYISFAAGFIDGVVSENADPNDATDQWTMDSDKSLRHFKRGF